MIVWVNADVGTHTGNTCKTLNDQGGLNRPLFKKYTREYGTKIGYIQQVPIRNEGIY